MQRLRTLHQKQRYTQVSNAAIDGLPDLNSLGLLITYLRHHDAYAFDLKTFARKKSGVGEKAVYKARATLIEHGYLVQVKFRHSYRGRFCTEIYRSAEPHTPDDLALIAEKYAPGNTAQIPGDSPSDRERNVTITWVEITSWRGVEVSPAKTSGETKAQVGPDRGKVGTGESEPLSPDRAAPGTGRPGLGGVGTNKEEEGEHQRENQEGGSLPSVENSPPPPSPSANVQVAPGTDFQAPVEKREGDEIQKLEKRYPDAAAFVATLPTGGKARGKAHHSALITEMARLIDGGADLGKVRVALVSKLDTAGHWFSTMASRAAEYDPSSFMPAIPKAPAKPAESVPETTGAPQAPQTPGEANQRARAEIEATRKKLAEVNAQRRAERQRELSPAAA